jgi:hypothetical protein
MAYNPLDSSSDPFRPPTISTMVGCIHCGAEFESYEIEWRIETDVDGHQHGFWCCPMPGCDGRGFGFDIFPTDPEYRDEYGERMRCDDGEDDDDDWDEIGGDPPPADDAAPRPDVDEPLPW